MLTNKQRQAIENSIIGKPQMDTEMCFYIQQNERTNSLVEQLVKRLTELYGYALYEVVSQATKSNKGEVKYENVSRIRVLMSNTIWDQHFTELTWVIYAIMHLFGMDSIDLSIDGLLYRCHK